MGVRRHVLGSAVIAVGDQMSAYLGYAASSCTPPNRLQVSSGVEMRVWLGLGFGAVLGVWGLVWTVPWVCVMQEVGLLMFSSISTRLAMWMGVPM